MDKKEKSSSITARVLSMENGLIEYENVEYIKIVSKEYNLVIMKDYLPVIGEIKGRVEIRRLNQTTKIENITAYYIHKHNEFNLFIKER